MTPSPPSRPTRRTVLSATSAAALAATLAPLPARATALTQPATPEDEAFMRQTIALAQQHGKRYTALIVSGGEVIAEGINAVRGADGRRDPTGHGEIMAIRNCLAGPGADAMRGATLYTTGEPCPMCMGAIVWCRFGRVVFAASIEQLAQKMTQIMMPCADVAAAAPFAEIGVTGGVLADEAMELFG